MLSFQTPWPIWPGGNTPEIIDTYSDACPSQAWTASCTRCRRMRSLLPLALTVALLSACAPEGSPLPHSGAGGKADDLFSCPANPTLNAGSGSQRRCIDADNGKFVATACCADVCAGADWQSQANGDRCRWVDGVGLDGAVLGQFAPSMCCELNDSLECTSAQVVGGHCQSSAGDSVEPVCCQQAPITCHPLVAEQLRDCVTAVLADVATDPDAPPMSESEALDLCANEGDLMGPMLDSLCLVDPGFCDLDFESFALDFVAACNQEIAAEFTCAFGHTFGDFLDRDNLLVLEDRRMEHAEAVQLLSAAEKEQVIIALHQSSHTDVVTLSEAFAAMDAGELRAVSVLQTSTGRTYQAFEYGAGDNSFGAIFDTQTGALAARIIDGDLYDSSSSASLGCDISED